MMVTGRSDVRPPDHAESALGEKSRSSRDRAEYQPPRLVQVGNVHDLVAGSGGTNLDAGGLRTKL
jgi:hypothetical protein